MTPLRVSHPMGGAPDQLARTVLLGPMTMTGLAAGFSHRMVSTSTLSEIPTQPREGLLSEVCNQTPEAYRLPFGRRGSDG